MKRRLTPLILTAVLIIFATCKKDPEVNIESFEISREVVTPGTTSVSISGIYEYPGKIDAIRLSVGTRIDFKDAKDYLLDLDGNTFSIRVDSLRSSTEYRYRYEVDYGAQEPFITEANTFTTKDVSLPVVSTATVSFIGANDAFCGGDVTDSGGDVITARGVCWSTEVEPTLSCPHTVDSCGIGEFTSHIEGLVTNTRYYVRAYATNSQGTAYGNQLQFTTTAITPTVITSAVTNITQTSATCGGNVTDDGGSVVTERGICWSTSHNPTTDNTFANSGTGIGSFAVQMSNLVPNYTYYVRAYAKNAQGTSYGAEVSFTALEGLPEVTTSNVTDITATTAKCGGNVTSQGGSAVTERGVCWSTSHNPTTSNSHANGGMGTGSFTCNLTGLTIGTTYYVRAYATNSMGIVYGEEKEFSTAASLPTVITSNITNITQTSAQGGGEVLSDGGTAVTERGICWSTSHNPTTNDSHATNGAGIGGYTISMTGLTANTTYYVRAYATNAQGTAYGSEFNFTTGESISVPSVITAQVTNITSATATGSGNVTNDGGAMVTERGICWSTSQNPTVSGSHVSNGQGTGTFTAEMTGLNPYTTYYVRAYAINSAGASYGEEVFFMTLANLPTVITSDIINITQTTAQGGGNVTSNGGAVVTARGICWSISHNPTISSSHTSNGIGSGSFTSSLTNLIGNTTYYVRAYATNGTGTAYGNEVSFTISNPPQAPVGAINGLFTVNTDGNQVYFSQGNLQYIGSHGTPYWQFAEHQWDYLGYNGQGSESQDVDRDLFGWGTSGYNHGAVCYQPWSTSANYSYYYAYGNYQNNLYDQTGKADWGYNPISNGGNQANQWRSLTKEEWEYVLNTRNTLSGIRYAKAQVNNVNGIILVPDEWNSGTYTLNCTNASDVSFIDNIINEIVWSGILEPAGCVFLPTSGQRIGNEVGWVEIDGFYWSSTYYNSENAYFLNFDQYHLGIGGGSYQEYRCRGRSVRLVQDYIP